MTWRNIPVRIRLADETKSIAMGIADSDDLDQIVGTLRAWGTYPEMTDPAGQFVIDHDAGLAFFEVILMDRDA